MDFTRRMFLGGASALAARPLLGAVADDAVARAYETADGRATDAVLARRIHLDLAGRIPTVREARDFVASAAEDKCARLVDRLLAADSFADYWSLHLCDILRVKSEFPINLWPNAVYVYHRRVRTFLRNDEPWDRFARALITATGSDFRDAEANFFRATPERTPEGFAAIVAQTFLGEDWAERHPAEYKTFPAYFANVRIKGTREWKEELVLVDGQDRRGEFCKRLTQEWRRDLAAALVTRVDRWLFGDAAARPEHVDAFLRHGLRLKPLLREIALSDAYARGPVTGGYPCRRLDAEVLDDAIRDFTNEPRDYQSIAPEPFTFLPPRRRSVLIEDGSISSAFLTLFGRPARDTGRLDERHNDITAKQRLYLFNSGRLYGSLARLVNARKDFRRRPLRRQVDSLYWRILSRPPTAGETERLMQRFQSLPKGRERGAFPVDLAWALVNTREFLYQH